MCEAGEQSACTAELARPARRMERQPFSLRFTWLLFTALVAASGCSASGREAAAAPCEMKCQVSSPLPDFFVIQYDARPGENAVPALQVGNTMLTCQIRATEESKCSVDVFSTINPYIGNQTSDVLINLSLEYLGQSDSATPAPELILSSTPNETRKNVIALFTVISLSFAWDQIDYFASLVNLVVLKLVDCTVVTRPDSIKALNNLPSIMTLSLVVRPGNDWRSLNSFLPKDVHFPAMAEFYAVCGAATSNSNAGDSKNSNIMQNVVQLLLTCNNSVDFESLMMVMPRLQALELTDFSSIKTLPTYPWNDNRLRLPSNLSRTAFFQSHYTIKNSLILEKNMYRRVLNFRGNNVVCACNCSFGSVIDRIDMDRNDMYDIAEDCFLNATALQYLKLNNNLLTRIKPTVFSSLVNLTKLYLQNNSLEILEADVFTSLTSLQYLNLAFNRLKVIQSGLFKNLANLKYLSLRGNMITYVDSSAFPLGSTALSYVMLRDNQLTDIPLIAFRLRNTLVFDLSGNNITFTNLGNTLAHLEVDSTRVFSVDSISDLDTSDQLSTQTTQIKIDLRRNMVQYFPLETLGRAELANLGFVCQWFELNLNDNPMVCDCHAYKFLQDLQSIKAVASNFETWKCFLPIEARGLSLFSAPNTTFACPEKMANCPPTCECLIRSTDNATIVDCNGRTLTAFPSSLPSPKQGGSLIVDLRHNKIEVLEASEALFHVSSLVLSNNVLTSIEDAAIYKMSNIRELHVDNNRLTGLPLSMRETKFTSLGLKVNYWPCDCTNHWMKAWLQRERAIVEDLYLITCSSSREAVRGIPITEVNDDDFVCVDEQFHLKLILGIFVTLLALVLISVALTYKYFSEIKIILYAQFYWHPFDRIDDDNDTSKCYDVFVSYSSQDGDWVIGTLCSVLEKRVVPPLKTCIHDKDFTVGCSIYDNILQSVKLSRRMIVVLSKSFVQSEWCMLEFRTAHEKVMKEHNAYLVVVLLDNIDVKHLDDSLKSYLSTNTYLHVGNKWFWNKLLYAMPQKAKPRLHPDIPRATEGLDHSPSTSTVMAQKHG